MNNEEQDEIVELIDTVRTLLEITETAFKRLKDAIVSDDKPEIDLRMNDAGVIMRCELIDGTWVPLDEPTKAEILAHDLDGVRGD